MTLKIKKEIIFTAKKLVDIGFNLGAEGNLSIRKNKDIYITPSGIDAYNLNDKQICVLDQTGKLESKNKPSSETNLHMMLYKKRKDICNCSYSFNLGVNFVMFKDQNSIFSLYDSRVWG